MSFDSYSRLTKLYKKHGPHEFGRICQALLEISFREIKFKTRGRAVERPDISAERYKEHYAVEVKVPVGNEISITKRDLDGLYEFASSNVTPVVAVLLVEPDSKWIISKARNLKPGKYNKITLSAHDISSISTEINSIFPEILKRQFEIAIGRGSEGLRGKLVPVTRL